MILTDRKRVADLGLKRIVDTGFWTDSKVTDFSPEDKYFLLYLLTNPATTQLGIYELSIKQAAFLMGYSIEAIKVLIDRFQNKYGMILFSESTNEVAILNFLRHSIVKGGAPVRDCLIKEIMRVKDKMLLREVFSHVKGYAALNSTVGKLITEYEENHGALTYCNKKKSANDNENDNENDNDVSSTTNRYNDTFPRYGGDDKQKNEASFASSAVENEKQIKKSQFFDEHLKEVITLWDRASGRIMTGWESQQIVELLDLYGKDRVVQAINAAAANNSVKINYVTAVLENRGKKATAANKSKLTPEEEADLEAWLRGE